MSAQFGFEPEEIRTDESTRTARLKWVILIDRELDPGRAANAAVCVAAATATEVKGLLGPDGKDAAGAVHAGLPWAGCTILGATRAELAEIRAKVTDGVHVTDMPEAAQATRVYDDYLRQLAGDDAPAYLAVSLVGPRNRIDKLVKRLPLLQ
ncbi:DUF2000 domain-containing protein [Actinoplanes sp. NPDC049265]|uniref:DUF2000 domain-containing protein n=1 Tax=Actinoplanes sp. NPDC049265 TaxID=3363902 RepID=UPI003716E501